MQNENTPLFAEERKSRILSLLDEKSKVSVPDLCELFHVSPPTIRSDLRELENEGKLKRTHGGAIPLGKASFEPDTSLKAVEHVQEKARIAAAAAQLVEKDDIIALDTGTTTFEIAKQLVSKQHLTVVINDIQIANFLEANSNITIFMIGGIIRRGFHCTTGSMALSALASLNVDKVFMATNGFSVEKGFTTPNLEQSDIKKKMMSIASEVIMTFDSSKVGRNSFIKFADLDQIDKIITDGNISEKTQAILRESTDLLLV